MKLVRWSAIAGFLAGSAQAQNFNITAGNIKFSLDGYDTMTRYSNTLGVKGTTIAECDAAAMPPAPGSYGSGYDTMLIFSVTNISNITTGETLFSPGLDGYLTGIISGLSDTYVQVTGSISPYTQILSTGGTLSMWEHDTNYNPALGPLGAGVNLPAGIYPGISDGGSLYLQGQFVPGVLAGNTQSTFYTDYRYLNGAPTGGSQGFLDLTGGSALNTFNTNALNDQNGVARDLFLTRTYDDVNGSAANIGWTVKSRSQITGYAIPEPGSLVLVALGLGAGVALRRRSV